jgi:uncharacterized membrane protein YqhA
MKPILRVSRYPFVVTVVGCIAMFGIVTIYAAVAVGHAILKIGPGGFAPTDIASVTVSAFKIVDLFLLGTILYIVVLGLAALFLDSEAAVPRRFKIRELRDLKMIVSQSVVVVMLVALLGDLLEWEQGSDIAFVAGGVAAVIAAIAFTLRSSHADDRRH